MVEKRNVFNTASLIYFLSFQLFQTDEAFTLSGNKHTHTHTHTHAHTHTHSNCKATHNSKTSRHFFTELRISNLTGKCLKSVKQSAISHHLLGYNCSIDFDHSDILASEAKKFRHPVKESLLIKQNHQVISDKAIWLRHLLIECNCIQACCDGNIEADERYIWLRIALVFKHIFILLIVNFQ